MAEPAVAASAVPSVNTVTFGDLAACLRLGWRDFTRAPLYGLFFAAVYVAGGWLIWWALTTKGQLWWTLVASAGFPILAPFLACGLYEVSRRLEAGEPLDWSGVLGVVLRQKDRQIPSMAVVIVVFFLFWNFLGHMIFALFMGLQTMTDVSSSFGVFLTPNGLTMLAVGTAVGAVFALDREVDFVTAMIASFGTVRTNPVVMLGWGALIACILFLAMLPAFLGLFVALPVLGHATWHLYRRALS
jgi:uncharacterized membrane protein